MVEIETEGHVVVDCTIRDEDSDRTDNNDGADYRLWIASDPVDSHVHTKDYSDGSMGSRSLVTALGSAGMTDAVVSWADNDFVDLVVAAMPWLTPLVWVRPAYSNVEDVRKRLEDGAAGLKLHPAYDHYPADSPTLDPYLQAAADARVPVAVHSGPGTSDPTLIRRLAERFPTVPVVLYHTYLGHPEGRFRASRHAREVANLHLETSWCSSMEVVRLIDEVGPDQVLFGSDGAIDGPLHFVRQPPNVELTETYNQGLLRLARRLAPDVFRKLVETNTRTLFGLASTAVDQSRPTDQPDEADQSDEAERESR